MLPSRMRSGPSSKKRLKELGASLEQRLKIERDQFNSGDLARKIAERKAKVSEMAEQERALRREHVKQKLKLIDDDEAL